VQLVRQFAERRAGLTGHPLVVLLYYGHTLEVSMLFTRGRDAPRVLKNAEG
jgi:hypothetical protein